MTTVQPVESKSSDRTAVSGEGQDAPSVDEMVRGQRFLLPNQVHKERVPAWRADLRPYSLWNALCATIIANLRQPFGESRLRLTAPNGRARTELWALRIRRANCQVRQSAAGILADCFGQSAVKWEI